jgi:hypothetical protein
VNNTDHNHSSRPEPQRSRRFVAAFLVLSLPVLNAVQRHPEFFVHAAEVLIKVLSSG